VEICSQELYETRVLSRDMLKVHEDVMDIFSQIGNEVGNPNKREGCSVAIQLVGFLDALQPNGKVDERALPGSKRLLRMDRLDGERVRVMCTKVADVIEAKFAKSSENLEERYNIFPAVLETTIQNDDTATILDGLKANSASPGEAEVASKKKHKKKSRSKAKADAANGSLPATASRDSDDLGEVTDILKQLLISGGSNVEARADQAGTTRIAESLIQMASAAFTHLRDTTIPPYS
jgi:hypothetical protein